MCLCLKTFANMCETSQIISEDLVEVLNNLILNLFLFKVRSHLHKA